MRKSFLKKNIFVELLIIPLIIFILTLLLDSMLSSEIINYPILSNLLLTRTGLIFDEMKILFIAVLLLLSFNLLFSNKINENEILCRLISLVLELLLQITIFSFIIVVYNKVTIYTARIIIIYIGQLSFLTLNSNIYIKKASTLSTILLISMISFFVLYKYL